jgi:Putative zinc-finger
MWRAFRRSKKGRCSGTRDALSGYMDGRLNPEEAVRVEEHLNTCRGCREELESLRATVALLHRLPEVTPSRSFALAPVKPLPGRRVLPALRFATAGAVVLLAAAFAVDWSGAFDGGMLSNLKAGPAVWDYGADTGMYEEGESCWVVSGFKNGLSDNSQEPADLVVPDGSDNVVTAVKSLTSDGILLANVVALPAEGTQLALTEGSGQTVAGVGAEEFSVVTASDTEYSPFATNNSKLQPTFYSIMEGQDESYLNMLSSDNNVLYSFNLGKAQKEVIAAKETDWLRPLEYSLIGLAAVLGSTAAALWLRQRRAMAAAASYNRK